MRVLIKHDSIRPLLRNLVQYWRKPTDFVAVCSRAMLNDTQDFYTEKNSVFWGQIGGAFTDTHDNTTPRITVQGEHGAILQHKVSGGRINARPGGSLAIPATPEARAAGSPSLNRHPPLKLVVFGGGKTGRGIAALVESDVVKKTRAGWQVIQQREKVWYWLKRFVDQQPDPQALPDPDRTMRAVLTAAVDRVARVMKTGRKA